MKNFKTNTENTTHIALHTTVSLLDLLFERAGGKMRTADLRTWGAAKG